MTVYEPIKVGDKVTDNPSTNHCGTVLEIRKATFRAADEAYVKWHKGYSSWIKLHNLELWQEK